MRWTSEIGAGAVRARLGRSLHAIAVRLELPNGERKGSHPLVAACSRRCAMAGISELFTDIERAPDAPEVRVPRLRLCAV
jgi:hypothetical protein